MGWKATGTPTVRQQRDKWVVRVDGIDTETGRHRPRQLGTYQSQRAASRAARAPLADGRLSERGTLGWLVHRYVASRTDVSRWGKTWVGFVGRLRAAEGAPFRSPMVRALYVGGMILALVLLIVIDRPLLAIAAFVLSLSVGFVDVTRQSRATRTSIRSSVQ